MEAIERGRLQPVAVAQPFRDEMRDVGAEELETSTQDHRRGHPVDVVVAMDGDPLAVGDGAENPVDRQRHVGQTEGIVQIIKGR
jgi:hypothetical protein